MAAQSPYFLSANQQSAAAVGEVPAGRPSTYKVKVGDSVKEIPVSYLWKDALITGDYMHPASGRALNLSTNRIDRFVEGVKTFVQEGIDIPVPVDHKVSADTNLGFVVDAKREGDKLMLLHMMVGEDATVKALRNKVSVRIDPVFVDSKDQVYRDVITHSSLTPIPVITGQSDFAPIAASRGQQSEAIVFELAAANRSPMYDANVQKLRDFLYAADQLACIRQCLGLAADASIDDATIWNGAIKLIQGMMSQGGEYSRKVTDLEAKVTELTTQNTQAAQKIVELTNQATELSRQVTPPKAEDPALLGRWVDIHNREIDGLTREGKIKPAQATLLKQLVKEGDKVNPVVLSREGQGKSLFERIIGIFEENGTSASPVGGSTTGAQVLSRPTGDTDTDKTDESFIKERAARVNR